MIANGQSSIRSLIRKLFLGRISMMPDALLAADQPGGL
jgi:hypothetical protein